MSYRRQSVRRGPEPAQQETRQVRPEPALPPSSLPECPPPSEAPIAMEWKRFVEAIDISDKIVEAACTRFSAVCNPSSGVNKTSVTEEKKDANSRSDMADAIAFETGRLQQVYSKLAALIDRCQL